MKVTRISQFSGIVRTMDLPITQEQIAAWGAGAVAQRAFANLSDGEREFLLSGATPEEWDAAFPPEDEEDGDLDEPAF